MGGALARSDYLREVTALRATVDALTREIEWLRETFVPALAFPSVWRLTSGESAMLAALHACKGYLRKEALHHALNGDEPDTDIKIVDIYVHKLRRKLAAVMGDPIETRWGQGYGLTRQARAAIGAAIAGGHATSAQEGLMAFERIIVGLKQPKRLASIVLRDKSETGRPKCGISLRKEFVDTFGLKPDDKLEVQVGTGDDAGRMRFVRARQGVSVTVRKGGATISLGHVPSLGEVAMAKTAIDVRLIDQDTIEIALPDAAGEAMPRVSDLQMTALTLVVGKSRIAKLAQAAASADLSVEVYAARLFASVIDDDASAHREAA